jgi:hypothetical protein
MLVGRSTIARILSEQGIPPSGQRPMAWRTFMRAHWPALRASDLFTGIAGTLRGLVTHGTAFITELYTWRPFFHLTVAGGEWLSVTGHPPVDEQVASTPAITPPDARSAFNVARWRAVSARHSGHPRAPDACPRTELRHRCRAVHVLGKKWVVGIASCRGQGISLAARGVRAVPP